MEPNWSTRQTFERYLYDYLVKRNMHHTAEVFRNETNLLLDPGAASPIDAMDVPEGFLLEWWSLNYDLDCFKAWLQMRDSHAIQGCYASQEAGYSMNVEKMNQLPDNFTPAEAFSKGCTSMPSHVIKEFPLVSSSPSQREVSGELLQFLLLSLEVSGELPQLLLPLPNQEELLTLTKRAIVVANANGPKAKPEYTGFSEKPDPVLDNLINSFWLVEDQPRLRDKSIAGESSRNVENLVACGQGNSGMNELAGSPPESTQSRDDHNSSETSDGSSYFRIITADEDSLMVHPLESNEET